MQFGEYSKDYYVYRYNYNGYDRDFITLENCQYAYSDCSESNRVLKYSAGTPIYWKIIRVNGDGSLRLIYNGVNMDDEDQGIGMGVYEKLIDDSKYTGYTYDRNTNEIDSVAKIAIDTWYKNVFANTKYDEMIIEGRFCSDSSGYKHGSNEYGFSGLNCRIYSSYDRLMQKSRNFIKDNTPTFICPQTEETYGGAYRLKAWLITADEAAFSGMSSYVYENDSYLSSKNIGWTMTPYDRCLGDGYNTVWDLGGTLITTSVDNITASSLNPVINISSEYGFIEIGDGTKDNPYVISKITSNTNNYKGTVVYIFYKRKERSV